MAKRKSNHDTNAWPESTVKASSDAARDFLGPIMNATVPLLLFEFSEEHWAEIEKSLQRLQLDQASLKKAQAQLRSLIRCYFLALVNHDGNKIRKKWVTQHWTKIAKLSHELGHLLSAVSAHEKANGPPTPEGAPLLENLYEDHQLALLKLEILARRRLSKTDIEKLFDEVFPNTRSNTRVLFQFGVLEVWMHFGGKLGVSRHPDTGKVTGPLARYFSAGTQPICGGSPESLPDIVARQETLRAARRKLRRKLRRELGP